MGKLYEGVVIDIQPGDILTSKLGFIMQGAITKEWFKFYKQEYRGNGHWIIIGEKKPVDVKKLRGTKK